MRGPIIIYRSSQKSRQEKALEIVEKELNQKINWDYLTNFPDINIIEPLEDKKSIGIAQVKLGINFLQEKPLALKTKILIISRADMLTADAQNAMLKILEEPPEYALILLLTKAENTLLPTVVSRCRKFRAGIEVDADAPKVKTELTFAYILKLNLGERLDWAEETAKEEKELVIEILENWITEGRGMLSSENGLDIALGLEKVISTVDDLENTNVGVRLALEKLLIDI
jgi:DNA polymerase III delta prime subunit